MKKYFLLLILSLFAVNLSFAQHQDPVTRFKDPDADKFIGTWKYESVDYSFTITFTKGNLGGYDILFGTYQVQKSGQFYDDEGVDKRFVQGGTIPNGDPNEIIIHFPDLKVYYKKSEFLLTMQNGYNDRAVFTLVSEENRSMPEGKSRQEGNLLPPNGAVLIKQPNPQ